MVAFFLVFLLFAGCADSGYHQSYIISHTEDESPDAR
jgi:hypothetical protein